MKARVGRFARRLVSEAMRPLRNEHARLLFWSVYYPYNFGDWIGPFLYEAISGSTPWFAIPSDSSRSTVFMAAGSIFELARSNSIVWGSGVLRASVRFPRPWRITAVRGPLTRQIVLEQGYRCPEVFGDPGILLPRFYTPIRRERRMPIGLVPHYQDLELVRTLTKDRDDVLVIDVRHPIEQVADAICSCERVLSSSLHGLIVAHAYQVPARWVRWHGLSGDGIKYHDYLLSVGAERYEPLDLSGQVHSAPALSALVDEEYLPDSRPLVEPLLQACPFPRRGEG